MVLKDQKRNKERKNDKTSCSVIIFLKSSKMGSKKVYDAKQQNWVPYVPDYDESYQHFLGMSDGYVRSDRMGLYVVGSGKRNRKLNEMEAQQRQREIEIQQQQRRNRNSATTKTRGESCYTSGSRDSQIRNRM